jgi:hypothetical protein
MGGNGLVDLSSRGWHGPHTSGSTALSGIASLGGHNLEEHAQACILDLLKAKTKNGASLD